MTTAENPDQTLIRRFIAGVGEPLPVRTNPLLEALNTTLTGHDNGSVTLRYEPPDLFRQGLGVVQGGIVSAMLDFAMAFAGMTVVEEGNTVTTTTMTTSFYGAARGKVYEAVGKVEKRGRRVIYTSASLSCEGKEIAAATSTLLVI